MAHYVDDLGFAAQVLDSALGLFSGRKFPDRVFSESLRAVHFAHYVDVFDPVVWDAWLAAIDGPQGRIAVWDADGSLCASYLVRLRKLPLAVGDSGIRDLVSLLCLKQSTGPTLEFRLGAEEVWVWDVSSSWACWAHQSMNLAVLGLSPALVPKWKASGLQSLMPDDIVGEATQYYDELPDPRGWLEKRLSQSYPDPWA